MMEILLKMMGAQLSVQSMQGGIVVEEILLNQISVLKYVGIAGIMVIKDVTMVTS